jgi:hypothetical protein
MYQIYKTKSFTRWASKAGLTDLVLIDAVIEMVAGLVDADLGGGVVKKRVAQPGHGKRGSARTLLATNFGDRWIFVYGFEKNERSNINSKELAALKLLASDLLALDAGQLSEAVAGKALIEVKNDTTKN